MKKVNKATMAVAEKPEYIKVDRAAQVFLILRSRVLIVLIID